jgi:hypothetical protein
MESSWKTTLQFIFSNNLPSTFVWVVDIWIVEQKSFTLENKLKGNFSIPNKKE